MKNKKIVLAGGTGFIGQALAELWGRDNQVIILSRQPADIVKVGRRGPAEGYHITYWHWDGRFVEKHWAAAVEGADVVINLAGRSVNCRYNERNQRDIIESRVDATRVLGQAIREATVPPKLWINAASATIYRHAEDRPQDEYTGEITERPSVVDRSWSRRAVDFSVRVCKQWEEVFAAQRTPFTRKVALRIAITLGKEGVLGPYLNMLKWGLGGRQGSGRQMYSWVHIIDLARVIEWFVDHAELEGVYNVAAPGPVTNSYFMATLRRLMGIRVGLPAPVWLLRLGAWLIGTEPELVLKSRWVMPTRLMETGFCFRYTRVEDALANIISSL